MMQAFYFVVSSVCLTVIFITMLCRANDLRWRPGFKWQVRLVGFVVSGTMPIGVIATELYTGVYPSPYEACFRLGLAMVFVTTPHLPPWWKWISGKESVNDTN